MNNKIQNYIRIFFVYLAASLFIGVPFALLNGVWPKSVTGWFLIFIFGLPTIIVGEFIGEQIFSDKISQRMDKENKDKIISVRRISYALIIGIATTLVIVLLGFLLRAYVGEHFNIQ